MPPFAITTSAAAPAAAAAAAVSTLASPPSARRSAPFTAVIAAFTVSTALRTAPDILARAPERHTAEEGSSSRRQPLSPFLPGLFP